MSFRVIFVAVIQDNNIDDSGLRRGARVRYAPLDWWRNEKVVYGRRGSGGTCLVPSIKEIRRIPKEDPVPLGKNARKRSRPPRSMSKTVEVEEEDLMLNPEEGWDDDTQADAPIVKFITGEEVVTRKFSFSPEVCLCRDDGSCRSCMDCENVEPEACCEQRFLLPEGFFRLGFHSCRANHHSPEEV